MSTDYYRLDLTQAEYDELKSFIMLDELKQDILKSQKKGFVIYDKLLDKINNPRSIKYSAKKSLAADKATEARSNKAKAKIDNAINILRMENKEITHYSISKTGNVSYNTVKKYISLDDMKALNKLKENYEIC